MDNACSKPNVLIIVVDQLRRDGLGCYGDDVTQTPHMDALAARGTRFQECMSMHPVCSPWRATLQTGHYAWTHGVERNNLPIDTSLPSLADVFNAANYHTAFYGKAHWWNSGKPGWYEPKARLRYQEWWGFNRGHFHWDTPDFDDEGNETHRFAGQYEPEVQTERSIEFIEREHDTPWMLCLNYGPPHNASMDIEYNDPRTRERMRRVNEQRGWGLSDDIMDHMAPDDAWPVNAFPQHLSGRLLPEAYLGMYPESVFPERADIPDTERDLTNAMRREYSAMTTSIDDQVGALMDSLQRSGQLDNTIVILTADHGDHLGAQGRRRGKATPLQAAWRTPLLVAGPGIDHGRIDHRMVSGVDLFPSICGWAGLSPPESLPGFDVAGEASREVTLIGLANWRCLVTKRYSYAAALEDGAWRIIHLIDLLNDPWDLQSISDKNPQLVEELQMQLEAEMQIVGDPLLKDVATT